MSADPTTSAQIDEAARILARGGLVAFPTETVYGLGADARDPAAVRRVFEVKGRPPGHPLIVHLPHAQVDRLDAWATGAGDDVRTLARHLWPGPLTIVVRRTPQIPDVVTGGLDTVGLRVPAHPIAMALLEAFGSAVAAPSANRFGSVSPTRAEHVREDLGDDVDMILDGGPCTVGVESTIVDLSSASPAILRVGAVSRQDLEHLLGREVPVVVRSAVRAPGTLPSHYAPRARVELASPETLLDAAAAHAGAGRRVAVLGRPSARDVPAGVQVVDLPPDPDGMAARLYDALREADLRGLEVLVAVAPDGPGLLAAVADRLRRAAGPR